MRQAASFVLLGLVCPATVWYGGLSVTPPMIGGLSVPALLGGCRSVCLSVTHNCLGSRLRFQTWDFHAYAISKSCMPAGSPAFTTCHAHVALVAVGSVFFEKRYLYLPVLVPAEKQRSKFRTTEPKDIFSSNLPCPPPTFSFYAINFGDPDISSSKNEHKFRYTRLVKCRIGW